MAGLTPAGHPVGQMPNHAVDGHLNMGYANSGQMASRTSSAGSQIGYEMANANLNDPVQLRQPSEGFHTAEGFHDKYEIGETLGKGSFAVVKEARHRQSGERFAIKMIDRNNPGFDGEALKKEIRIMQLINHPNCIRLHEVYHDTGMICLVLDLVTGGELFDRIIARGYYSEKDAAEVSRDVLQAVAYLHGLGIVHRDLKPENLLYMSNDEGSREYNQIKVADFGLAKCKSPDSLMRTMCGTPGYVAPEVLDPRLAGVYGYGPQVDIWSIGVVVYIMLCGFPPFYSENTVTLFRQIRRGDYAFPSPYWDNISAAAKDLVCKMLVVDPAKRLTAEQCLEHEWITKASLQVDRALGSQHKAFLLIRRLPLFEQVDPECLSEVTARLQRITAKPGSYIIHSGEEGKCMYFVGSTPQQTIGSGVALGEDLARGIQRSKCLSVIVDGHEVTRLGTGDYFGEVALVSRSDHRRTADVITLSTCELYMLSREDMEAVTLKFPILQARLQSMAEARLKRAQSNTVSMSQAPGSVSTGSNSSFGSGHSHDEHAGGIEGITSPKSGGGAAGMQNMDPGQQQYYAQQQQQYQSPGQAGQYYGQQPQVGQPLQYGAAQPMAHVPAQYQPPVAPQQYMGQYQAEQPAYQAEQPAGLGQPMSGGVGPPLGVLPYQAPQPPLHMGPPAPQQQQQQHMLQQQQQQQQGGTMQPPSMAHVPPNSAAAQAQAAQRRARGKRRPEEAQAQSMQGRAEQQSSEHPVFDHDKAQRHQMLYQRQPSKVFLAAPEAVPRIDGILRMSSKLGVMDNIDQGLLAPDWLVQGDVNQQYAGTTVATNRQMLRPPPLQGMLVPDNQMQQQQMGAPLQQQQQVVRSSGGSGGSSGSMSDPSPRVLSQYTAGRAGSS